jgi:hypothetical protein
MTSLFCISTDEHQAGVNLTHMDSYVPSMCELHKVIVFRQQRMELENGRGPVP